MAINEVVFKFQKSASAEEDSNIDSSNMLKSIKTMSNKMTDITRQAYKNIMNEQRQQLVKQREETLKKQMGIKTPASGLLGDMGFSKQTVSSFAKIGKILGIAGAILGTLGKLYQLGLQNSAQLQATHEIFKKAWTMAFKPLGDAISQWLRPVAIFLIKYLANNLREISKRDEFYKNMEKLGASKGGAEGTLLEYLGKAGQLLDLPTEVGVFVSSISFLFSNLKNFILGDEEKLKSNFDSSVFGSLLTLYAKQKDLIDSQSQKLDGLGNDYVYVPFNDLYEKNKSEFDLAKEDLPDLFKDNVKIPGEEYLKKFKENFKFDETSDFMKKVQSGAPISEMMSYATGMEPKQDNNTDLQNIYDTFFGKIKTEFEFGGITLKKTIKDKVSIPSDSWLDKFKSTFDGYKLLLPNTISTNVSTPLNNLFSALKILIDNATKKIESTAKTYSGGGASSGKSNTPKKVNDAIITKNGQIIQTHPDDNIIATKSLSKTSTTRIENMNVSITIQELNSDMQLREIATKVSEYIQRNINYKVAGGY